MSREHLKNIREYLINNIISNPDYLFSDEVRGETDEDADLLEIIASLYEVLHREVTGEPYDYMFHWANKEMGWVESDLFTKEEKHD
jgi:hypothetical protein